MNSVPVLCDTFIGDDGISTTAIIVIGLVVPTVVIILGIIVGILVIVLIQRVRKGNIAAIDGVHSLLSIICIGNMSLATSYALGRTEREYEPMKPERLKHFRMGKVLNDCELKEVVTNVFKFPFKKGQFYYEFTHEIERISECKEIIFMKQVSNIICDRICEKGPF